MTQQAGVDEALPSGGFAAAFVKWLVACGAPQRSAELFVELRGLGNEPPRSLRTVSRGVLSAERIRQLVAELEAGALAHLRADESPAGDEFRQAVATALRQIEALAPNAEAEIQIALKRTGADAFSPAGVLRMADIIGVHHSLRLTTWTARAKFADAECSRLASADSGQTRETVYGIVPADMPEIFENFINFARKYSRGAGVVAAGHLAERYGIDRGVALAPYEAAAFLRPFAVHLGRHDGDEWFSFFNSANDFIRKATTRVELFGHCSFETIRQFHERYNRSLYTVEAATFPESVLRAALELAGFVLDGDDVRAMEPLKGQQGRGISDVQALMVKVFRDTLALEQPGRRSVRRDVLVQAMLAVGIRESTARVYLGNQGLFSCNGGLCRLADTQLTDADRSEQLATPGAPRRGRPPRASKSPHIAQVPPAAPAGLVPSTYPVEG